MTTTALSPVLLLTGVVRQVERLSPSFLRIRLGGTGFDEVGPEGPTLDQRIKLFFPSPGHPLPTRLIDADSWYAGWLALPEDERGHVRTYTARSVVGEGEERCLVVDLVLHVAAEGGRLGPAATWAASARVGDEIGVLAPRRGREHDVGGIEFAPGTAGHLVLVADETALPALASILESLPSDARGVAVIEVPHDGDVLRLAGPSGVERHWIARGSEPRGVGTVARLRCCWARSSDEPTVAPATTADGDDVWETAAYSSSGATLEAGDGAGVDGTAVADEPGRTYAWVAGDADTVKACRRLLVGEIGLPRSSVAFMGYWRHGRPC
ncbi:MAG: siderophore-interacting protein [Humibacillus sp.]|nr:siderophore-interacting protein [Humibacillus sp.]